MHIFVTKLFLFFEVDDVWEITDLSLEMTIDACVNPEMDGGGW